MLAVASSHQTDELREADWVTASIDQVAVSVDPETATLKLTFPSIQISQWLNFDPPASW